ncbi:MAG: hypothetical protein J7M21_02760 [Planctomycetes bacterium]|nr:hypothetical protein [Planctomycetota bacterium]
MELLRYVFEAVLVTVLAASVVSFVAMGLAKVRRTRRLARAAHERQRRFFPDDPFDVPRRFADFALVMGGHSPRANNVTDGRVDGLAVRAFDFRCELGHGTRRTTRHYSVLAADVPGRDEQLLMWHDGDAELAPLAARTAEAHVGCWSCRGPAELVATVAAACEPLAAAAASIELRGRRLMVLAPAGRGADYAVRFEQIRPLLAVLRAAAGSA